MHHSRRIKSLVTLGSPSIQTNPGPLCAATKRNSSIASTTWVREIYKNKHFVDNKSSPREYHYNLPPCVTAFDFARRVDKTAGGGD